MPAREMAPVISVVAAGNQSLGHRKYDLTDMCGIMLSRVVEAAATEQRILWIAAGIVIVGKEAKRWKNFEFTCQEKTTSVGSMMSFVSGRRAEFYVSLTGT
jgi:hypothetical protein